MDGRCHPLPHPREIGATRSPEDEGKDDIQPSELPFGKPGQPGCTDPEGRMDATASREDSRGKIEGNLFPTASFRPRSTIRQMDLDHRGVRGNPDLMM